jgi:hypothetical protein
VNLRQFVRRFFSAMPGESRSCSHGFPAWTQTRSPRRAGHFDRQRFPARISIQTKLFCSITLFKE